MDDIVFGSKRSFDVMMNEGQDDIKIDEDPVIRAKWMFDDCSTIEEIIGRLREQITMFQKLKDDGWELRAPVHDDYGFLKKKSLDDSIPPSQRSKQCS